MILQGGAPGEGRWGATAGVDQKEKLACAPPSPPGVPVLCVGSRGKQPKGRGKQPKGSTQPQCFEPRRAEVQTNYLPKAKCLHWVRTACILRTQRLGYSPKNTCHLFTRGKTERCQYHRVGQVSIETSGCSYNQQHRRRRTVRSWCRLTTIEYWRSRAFERR